MRTILCSGELCKVVDGTMNMFRELTPDEVSEFRAWAHQQSEGTTISSAWHPVVQDELFITGIGKEEV